MKWQQVTSHDLWQPRHLPWSLSAAPRVMMALPPPRGIMTSQNISLPLKRETKLLILYIWTFTKRKVSLRYLVKGQLIYLSFHGWQNHRRVCSDTLSGRLLQERLNQESILVEIMRPSIWPLRGSLGTRGLNIGFQTNLRNNMVTITNRSSLDNGFRTYLK